MFNATRKRSDSSVQQSTNCITKDKPKFVRCVSIARLFGNAYSTHQHMSHQKNDANNGNIKTGILSKNRYHTNVATSKSKIERFKNRSESEQQTDQVNGTDCTDFCKTTTTTLTNDNTNTNTTTTSSHNDKLPIEDFCDEKDLSARAFRTISRGLGLIWRRSYSVEISTPDPEYKVFYLGNVLTGWAKGDNCIEKPLATLWRNYTQINKPDVAMRILVCSSGLKATTRQHGITEYWNSKITFCCAPKNYPRVFCWIYRHEGRKLKHELRCHAVLCPKESIAEEICKTLKENLTQALKEFKRDKMNRQNARLSLVNSLYENPSMPRRKILLSVGANNYRPPMERSKSAPKLMAIEEAVGEEEEICSMSSFKKSQSHNNTPYTNGDLFTVSTFDRKYCKRNRLNRDMANARRNSLYEQSKSRSTDVIKTNDDEGGGSGGGCNTFDSKFTIPKQTSPAAYDEDDDFHSLLMTNDYDIKSSLSGEILSYFDTKLSKSTSLSQSEIDSHPNALGPANSCVANEPFEFDSFNSTDDFCSLGHDTTNFNQNDVLKSLVMVTSDSKHLIKSNVDNSNVNDNCMKPIETMAFVNSNGNVHGPLLDSDEGSITSGCETSSIITTAHMDDLIKSEREIEAISLSLARLPSLKNSNISSNLECVNESDHNNSTDHNSTIRNNNEEDSEFSDESGFDENNSAKPTLAHNFRSATESICNAAGASAVASTADANNNIKHPFSSSNTLKTMGRLRINIPKNAKSIDI
ncbi:uncharacterized protein LOC116345156 [Contarinia nasturtii]|uniref:uncharacterized protein LOC116345156 n=1 Tax=Contarinia nasturtii TaxID=265458 RepID=UPI0012D399FD|nr:uncharacterized protein LOC116345156 [Contarinia nasturtii]XP_031630137.1 uncharacterized protein LOC116345156 [Contarinia nasturtii]XP_031630138.1 uncharacterized protein LOC116345156 [Contarinia nasturtii]XP_031630139.1 uncharacterized protein LOC116345156 [Contarinia nasturtii]XP_031630140.1 uncharacterized protein LOC116345156 [Contarinia nasturtii]XP_031630141.1 uncharacterized protein LOC116345156 [Contarinia nasturtii]XP_031630142.1 uncharacterized protein LOC116345156 [Contarinia n